MVEEEKGGFSSRLENIEEKLEMILPKPKIKVKPFKLKPMIRARAKKAHLKNRVLVFYLRSNRVVEPVIAKIKNNMVQVGEKLHDASMWYYYIYKIGRVNIPCLVIPEWKLTPIGTRDYELAKATKDTTDAEVNIIRAIEMKENLMLDKPSLGGKAWIWIIIGLAIVGYILFGGTP